MHETRASLLVRIRDPKDVLAWSEFVRLYAPLIHSYGMKHGLQDCDAADLTQETMRRVLRAAPEFVYDASKGSFRGWLFTIARNEIRKFAARDANRSRGTGDTNMRQILEAVPDRDSERCDWDRDYLLNLFHWAAKRVKVEFRDSTWQSFWRTVALGEEIETVARDLGVSSGAIYIARSRVTARIKREIAAVEGEHA